MSTTLAFRLILGLVVGGVLTCSVWDRNDRELKEQPADEDTRTGMPRFRSFAAAETLPTMLVMYLAISLAIGGREMAVQYLLGLLLRVFLLIGVYYVLLLAVLPLLRRHISARVCAVLWLLPGYLYFLAQVSSVQRADPGGERMLVLHASGTLVTVLLAVWACRPPATRRRGGNCRCDGSFRTGRCTAAPSRCRPRGCAFSRSRRGCPPSGSSRGSGS